MITLLRSPTGGFFLYELIIWVLACLWHYWSVSEQRVSAPRWLRILFGDLRSEGKLVARGVAIQSATYVVAVVGAFYAVGSALTLEIAVTLFCAHLVLMFIGVVLVCNILSRLSKDR
jgi:hypothetical protein